MIKSGKEALNLHDVIQDYLQNKDMASVLIVQYGSDSPVHISLLLSDFIRADVFTDTHRSEGYLMDDIFRISEIIPV